MSETIKEKNDRLLKAGFAFFEGLAKDPENNMFSNAIAVGRLIQDTEIRVRSEAADEIDALKARIAVLEEALYALLSWFPEKPSEPEWRLRAGEQGADDAVAEARRALEARHD